MFILLIQNSVSSFREMIDLAWSILVMKAVKTKQEKYSFWCWDAIYRIVLSLTQEGFV